jgi:hypothetical protein
VTPLDSEGKDRLDTAQSRSRWGMIKKGQKMKQVVTSTVITAIALLVNCSFALECPRFPEQTKEDWEGSVNAAVVKVGPLMGGDLKVTTRGDKRYESQSQMEAMTAIPKSQ